MIILSHVNVSLLPYLDVDKPFIKTVVNYLISR